MHIPCPPAFVALHCRCSFEWPWGCHVMWAPWLPGDAALCGSSLSCAPVATCSWHICAPAIHYTMPHGSGRIRVARALTHEPSGLSSDTNTFFANWPLWPLQYLSGAALGRSRSVDWRPGGCRMTAAKWLPRVDRIVRQLTVIRAIGRALLASLCIGHTFQHAFWRRCTASPLHCFWCAT